IKISIQLFLVIILASCAEKRLDIIQYKEGKQVLNANGIDRSGNKIDSVYVNTISPDTIKLGDEFYARVFLSNPDFKIVDALFDCPVTNESLADTATQKIIGCSKGFMVKQDTVRIHFTVGGLPGNRGFHEITILSKDKDNIYRYHKGSFKYFVKE